MSQHTRRTLGASLILGGVLAFALVVAIQREVSTQDAGEAGEIAEAQLVDLGAFREGGRLALRRAGFSGRPMVFVITGDEGVDSRLRADLGHDAVQLVASALTCATVPRSQAEAELGLTPPVEHLPVVLVRDVHGRLLGALRGADVHADSLVELLAPLAEREWPKSPLYRELLVSVDPLDGLIDREEYDTARLAIDMLNELEPGSEAAARANRRRSSLPESE